MASREFTFLIERTSAATDRGILSHDGFHKPSWIGGDILAAVVARYGSVLLVKEG